MMRIPDKPISRAPNPRPLCQELTMALAANKLWRWMLHLGGRRKRREPSHSMESETAMLMLPGCWRCSKQGHPLALTAKTRARTYHPGKPGIKELEETRRAYPRL